MVEIKLEYIIEKITQKTNGDVEILAFGYSSNDVVKPVSSEMEMIMRNVPPEMKQMMDQQSKMFEKQMKPMLRFTITPEQYSTGRWRVGDALETVVKEKTGSGKE